MARRTRRWRRRHLFHKWMLNGHPGGLTRPVRKFIVRAHNHGLFVTSTRDGVHSPTSWHYSGHAADVAAPMTSEGVSRMVRFQSEEWRRQRRGATQYAELFGPANDRWVKNGQLIRAREGDPLEQMHDNHVHGAFA
jgi:hypothetical protein